MERPMPPLPPCGWSHAPPPHPPFTFHNLLLLWSKSWKKSWPSVNIALCRVGSTWWPCWPWSWGAAYAPMGVHVFCCDHQLIFPLTLCKFWYCTAGLQAKCHGAQHSGTNLLCVSCVLGIFSSWAALLRSLFLMMCSPLSLHISVNAWQPLSWAVHLQFNHLALVKLFYAHHNGFF